MSLTITVDLPPDAEARLSAKARAAGVDLPTLAERILRAEAQAPSLDDLLAPVRKKFAESGLTEDEVVERYETEKHAARAAERGRPFDE